MKKCTKCGEVKDLSFFNKKKTGKEGKASQCSECSRLELQEYNRTKKGVIAKAYSHQKENSKKRGMRPPRYSVTTLFIWACKQSLFDTLFKKWVESGYISDLKPSIDRRDDTKGYTLDNIQLMTWAENRKKYHADRVRGVSNQQNKAVVQYTKSMEYVAEFHSINAAGRALNHKPSHICDCCKGVRKSAAGYIWRYKNG